MESIGFFLFLVVAGVIVLAIVLTVWVFLKVFGFFARALGGQSKLAYTTPVARCTQIRCHADNPAHARYCRRCGQAIIGRFALRAA